MKLSIIVIGDEILIGQVTDTNSGFISRTLGPMGWETVRVMTVGDNAGDIRRAVDMCMADSLLVITTGGLGPTKDDITKKVLCEIFGGELRRDPSVTENIRRVFQLRGLEMNALTADQALVPTSCRVIQNRFGTAPLMWFERKDDDHVLLAMPGVPFETEGMMKAGVADALTRHFTPDTTIGHRVAMVAGVTESALAERLDDFENSLPGNLHLAYLPVPGLIRLRLDGRGDDCANPTLDRYFADLKRLLGDNLVFEGDASPAEILIDALRKNNFTVASAESCTGGNIAHQITSVPGSSDVFLGSVVSYANSVKTGVLGVNPSLIEKFGAVSREVVEQMAEGVRKLTGADCAVATSGIAGPGGGSDEKPVGTVWFAIATPRKTITLIRHFPGNRQRVIDRATTEALLALASLIRH